MISNKTNKYLINEILEDFARNDIKELRFNCLFDLMPNIRFFKNNRWNKLRFDPSFFIRVDTERRLQANLSFMVNPISFLLPLEP